MTIVVVVLFVTSVWVFLAAVLGGCGCKDRRTARDADNVFTGEFWLWERGTGGIRLRAETGEASRPAAARPEGTALKSPTS